MPESRPLARPPQAAHIGPGGIRFKASAGSPFIVIVTDSITPRTQPEPQINFQPSMLSLRSSASTVAPEDRAPASAQQAPKHGARRKLWFFAALALVAGVAGASILGRSAPISSQVQSGSPGFKHSPSGHDLHWEKKALTVYLDKSLERLGPGAGEAVMQAFGQWVASDSRLPDLTFDTVQTSGGPKQDGKSTVSYGPITAPGHERDVAITISYSNDKSGEIIEADVLLNALYPMGVLTAKQANQATSPNDSGKDRNGNGHGNGNGHEHDWNGDDGSGEESMDCRSRYDAQNVATHEAGHFFGLGEDPVEKQATMFQMIAKCETHKRALAVTDVGAVTTLYTKSADPEEAKAGTRACAFGGAPQGSGALEISGVFLAFSLLRRRRAR